MTPNQDAPVPPASRPGILRTVSSKLVAGLLVALLTSGALLIALSVWLGQQTSRAEQEQAAAQLVRLFESSLHNSMLQRDIPSLESILRTLGQAPGITRAQLLNARGEVRFASPAGQKGTTLDLGCARADCASEGLHHRWVVTPDSRVLQTVYPIRNQTQCMQCHGDTATSPVNGLLVVDFSPRPLASRETQTAWIMALGTALLVFGLIMAWTLRRLVLRPLQQLADNSHRIAQGQLEARIPDPGPDEFGLVGRQFNNMAAQLTSLVGRLQGQQAFLQDLLDAIPDPVLVIGPQWRIRLANTAYKKLLGLNLEQPLQGTCHRIGRGLDAPCPATLVNCPHAGGHPVATMDAPTSGRDLSMSRTVMTLRHSDGHDLPVEIDSAQLYYDGEVFTVEVLRPLDRAIRFSQELRLSSIGLLANGVAHEIHNPLASIRLALQAALRDLGRDQVDVAQLRAYLELVDSQIDRCVATTHRLMQMSALPNEALQPVSLRAALGDVRALLAEDARQRQVTIDDRTGDQDMWLMADPAELRQVFINLFHNSMHAMPEGGQIKVQGGLSADGSLFSIEVSDTGAGIAPENLPRIFLPFFSRRADGRTGMGLGLAVCKSIVDRFGGTIEVRSQLGQGTAFTISLVVAESRTVAGARPQSPDLRPLRTP